jgi:putative ABC transport system permease protein
MAPWSRTRLSTAFAAIPRGIGTTLVDLKHAARTIKRQPGFSLAVALTIALGLALNATVLGMMDALLLRPFQFPDYQRLVVIWETPTGTSERQPVSPANYRDWRSQASSLQTLVAWEGWAATLTGRDEPERVQAFRVSPQFFDVLGATPVIGRAFLPGEEQPGRDRSVVIGDGLWKRRFGADPGVVGRQILLDGEPYALVGIAPPGFDFPIGSQAWAPLSFTPDRAIDRTNRTLTVLGKLAPDTPLAATQAQLDTISRRLQQQYPATNRGRGASVRTLSAAFREDSSGYFVGILQTGAGLVLLIACANLAGLLLARANDRRREVALRTALGAGKGRIVRQLMTETVLLGLVASVLALLLAQTGLEVLRSSMPAELAMHIEGWNNVRLDSRLVFVVPALAIGLGLLVGLIPATAATRTELVDVLKEGDRGAGVGRRPQRIRQALVVGEIACALALLVTAGLTFGGGLRLVNQPGGFDAQRLLTFEIPLPDGRYRDSDARRQLVGRLLERIQAIPSVQGVALANVLPAGGWSPTVPFLIDHAHTTDSAHHPTAGYRAVSSGFFEAMGIPIVRGRAFSTFDRDGSQPVAIVSASLAARYWPDGDPIGSRLRLDESPVAWVTVIGVAGDVNMYNWWDGIDFGAIYVPLRQAPPANGLSAAVRTRGEPTAVTGPVRAAIESVDRMLAVHGIRTMRQGIVASTFGLNFMAALIGICGGIAVALSFLGIYSMMSYAVSQRRREFGIRFALGATAPDVLRLTLHQAGVLTAVGVGIGLALAIGIGRVVSSAMYGLIALEPWTFAAVSLALAMVSFAAAYVPARRSSRLDPAAILRAE